MSKSYQEILDGTKKPQDNRTAEEIIDGFLKDFGA